MKAMDDWLENAKRELSERDMDQEEIEERFDLPDKRSLMIKLTIAVHEDIEAIAELLACSKSAVAQDLLASAVADALLEFKEFGYLKDQEEEV